MCDPVEDLDLSNSQNNDFRRAAPREDLLAGAVHVLNTEAITLQCLTQLYSTNRIAQEGFTRAVAAIARRRGDGRAAPVGKLVICGVGKSGHIGRKLVATFNSLGVQSSFLHPTEALHGDLGQIGTHDTLLLVTFSGKTPELLALLPHVDPSLPLIVLTSHTRPSDCELIVRARTRAASIKGPGDGELGPPIVLLPAPVHEPETISFGVPAPTSSTTAALSVGDALAIVASRELLARNHGWGGHGNEKEPCPAVGAGAGVAAVFARNHPGGAIGATAKSTRPPSPPLPSSAPPSRPSTPARKTKKKGLDLGFSD